MFKGRPNRGDECNLGLAKVGKLSECPFVFGTSRWVELMHTCRLQTFDPKMDFSLRNKSTMEQNKTKNKHKDQD